MYCLLSSFRRTTTMYYRPVGPGGAVAPPYFVRSVNPISTREADYAQQITNGTPGFSELPTTLY